MTRHSSHDDDTHREPAPTGVAIPRSEPDKPLPQHTESAEEIKWRAAMDKAREDGDENAWADARSKWIAAAQRRGSVGD